MTGVHRENEMATRIAHQAQLGITVINDGFPGTGDAISTPHEIRAGAATFQACGVHGRRFYPSPATEMQSNGTFQKPLRLGQSQQATRRFLQRGEVRHAAKFQQLHQRRMIDEMGHHPAIIGLEKVLQHQASEQLMLGELLGTIKMRIGRQRSTRRRQCRQYNRLRRLAGNCHIQRYETNLASGLS